MIKKYFGIFLLLFLCYSPLAYMENKEDVMRPNNIIEEEINVKNPGVILPGTLTLPGKSGPYPVVLLIQGSGRLDRNETTGPNKPFRDLAWGFAKNGIAVLRYDKRNKVYPNYIPKNDTLQEWVIDDVLAAITLLKAIPEINKEQIFLLGHSLGGYLMPRIALQASNLKGCIVLAGACTPFEDLTIRQNTYLYWLDGKLSDEEKRNLELMKQQRTKVKSPELSLTTPANELPFGLSASWWLYLRGYNPALTAQKIAKPFLILQGDRDHIVTEIDFKVWHDALSKRKDVNFKLYPGLNHLFIYGKGKPSIDDYRISGHVDEMVINDIALWIKKQIK